MSQQPTGSTTFLDLHQPGTPLLMPNPWDAGSAKLFASIGFHALATTSSGFAATLGRADGAVSREEANRRIRQAGLSALHNIRRVVRVEEIPVLGTGKTDYRALKRRLAEGP